MAETKFTPGPWRADAHDKGLSFVMLGTLGAPDEDILCVLPSAPDAHLIAAAPDLYAALEDAARCFARIAATCGYPSAQEACRVNIATASQAQSNIRAALAKARGEMSRIDGG